MKKAALMVLSVMFLFLFLTPQTTFADSSYIQLFMNGKKLNPEVAPRKIGNTSMVPIRIISEDVGAKVSWNQKEHRVAVEKANVNLQFVIDNTVAEVNGKSEQLETAPVLISGNTLMPVRFVAEQFGLQVSWDDSNQSVYLEQSGSKNISSAKIKTGARYKVVIDPGHGGHDSGAVSVTGRYEKDFTLSLGTKVKQLLDKEPMIDAYMTRTDDTFIPLNDRVAFANNLHADVFMSIHGNKWTQSARGTQTYYYNDFSLPFANIMQAHAVQGTGFPDGHVRQDEFRVIKYTTMPAILIECGFLSNETEETQMFDPDVQDRIAKALVAGIKEYLKID